MKRRSFLQLMGTLAAERLLHGETSGATPAPVEIAIDPSRELGRIHPRVHGQSPNIFSRYEKGEHED